MIKPNNLISMRKWMIKGKMYLFPKDWGIDKVMEWINVGEVIRVCPLCDKVDVHYDHFSHCPNLINKL